MKYGFGLAVAAAALLLVGRAEAGTVANGVWTATGCGQEPPAPTIDLSSADAFNKTLDANDRWEEAAKKYYDCAEKEAASDSKAVADAYKSVQDKQKSTIDKNEADVKAGMDKYAKKK